jgi:arabinogalactan endo-1,4-beta-galactosidase
MTEIVKVQRPVSPPRGPWLIYGEGRKHIRYFEPCERMCAVMGDDFKAYFEAELIDDEWRTGKRVENQDW